jgi:hypothetical protein
VPPVLAAGTQLVIEPKQPSLAEEFAKHNAKVWEQEVLRRGMVLRCDARGIAAAAKAGRN